MGVAAETRGHRGARLLLLLQLVVASASAECERPVVPHEMELTDETLVMSSYPEGVSVTVACYDGFITTSGTGLTMCTGGNWTEPDLVCTKKDCGAPPAQPNMVFDLSPGTLLGAIIKVTCKEGFQISGYSYKQCFASGWLGRSKCKVKDCNSPPLQPNMTVSVPNGTLYGAQIEVFCNEGYRLTGSRIRRCETVGWSGDPQCLPVTCDAVRSLANGRSSWVSEDSPTVGQTLNFACDKGYVLSGASAIVCLENGTYDDQPPTCLSVSGKFEVTSMTSMTSMASTSTPPTSASRSTDRASTTSTAQPDALASTSGDRSTPSTKSDAPTDAAFLTTSLPGVGTSNKFLSKQGHIMIIAALASVAFVVCIVCVATRSVFSKRSGSYDLREDLKPELFQFQSLWKASVTKVLRGTPADQ